MKASVALVALGSAILWSCSGNQETVEAGEVLSVGTAQQALSSGDPPVCRQSTAQDMLVVGSHQDLAGGARRLFENSSALAILEILTPGKYEFDVFARGEPAGGVFPTMRLSVLGQVLGEVAVDNFFGFEPYTFEFETPTVITGAPILVEYTNDAVIGPFDRNLVVEGIEVICPSVPSSSPCEGLCDNPAPISWQGSFQGGGLGSGAICLEATQPVVDGNCGNFAGGRTLSVNGQEMPCDAGNWGGVPAAVAGGYCISTTAGDYPWAFVTLW